MKKNSNRMQDNYWFDVNYEALFNVDCDSGIKYVCGCGIAESISMLTTKEYEQLRLQKCKIRLYSTLPQFCVFI